jgi:hypothetical protein
MTQRETPQVIGGRHVGLSARDPVAFDSIIGAYAKE